MAGYSGTPLARKLGLKPDTRAVLVSAPEGLMDELGALPDSLRIGQRLAGHAHLVLGFVTTQKALQSLLERATGVIRPDGMLWVSWPKKTSPLAGELDGNVVRRTGIQHGLVDIKVCAVNETWSALKFVIPVARR